MLFVAFMPFLEDIFQVLELKKGGKAANVIMMGTAFCISLSSGMTAIGHVWPTMAIGYYTAATENDVNQFQYMAMGIPTGIILIILLILVFKFLYRPDDVGEIRPEKAMNLRGTVPAADRKEKIILGVMFLTVLLWVAPSLIKGILPEVYTMVNSWSTAMPPLLGCVLLFIFQVDGERIMNFREVASKGVLWGSVLMTAAATQLGACLTNEDIGISTWLTGTLEPLTKKPACDRINIILHDMGGCGNQFFLQYCYDDGCQRGRVIGTDRVARRFCQCWGGSVHGRICGRNLQYDSCRAEHSQYGCHWLRMDGYEIHVCLGRGICGNGDSGAEFYRISVRIARNLGNAK